MGEVTRWMDVLRATWRRLFARPAEEARMDEEMRFHIDMETEKNIAEGMAPEEARRRALLAFGGVEKHRERMRDGRRVPFIEHLVQDVRYAARSLRRTPAFTAAVVLTLAVGIGATTAMYGVMSRLLILPPPHVAAPERVVRLYFGADPKDGDSFLSVGRDYVHFEAVRTGARSLSAVGAYTSVDAPVGEGADAMRAEAMAVSRGFWSAMGVRPVVGRLFSDEEAAPIQGARVAVLGYAFWKSRFGGDDSVVGRTIRIKGNPYEIVGVTPRGFRGVDLTEVDLWLPMSAYAAGRRDSLSWATTNTGYWLRMVGRLAPGVEPIQAERELSTIAARATEEADRDKPWPSPAEEGTRIFMATAPSVGALDYEMKPIPEARVAVWLVGIAVVLLGAACVSVASLLLLRAMRRRREIAVRLALGMGRGRMAAQLFTESLLLASLGGVVALAVAIGGGAWINRALLPNVASEPTSLDPVMLALTGACVVGSALLAGLAPLLQARFDPAHALREGTQHGSVFRSRLQRVLLVAQIALSVVLLVGAGLFIRSLQRIDRLDLGLDRDEVLVATIDFTGTGRSREDVVAFFERALERVRAVPGVERASLAVTIPLRRARGGGNFVFPEGPATAYVEDHGSPSVNYVTPDFFSTVGTRIVAGRDFRPSERNDSPVMLVNETFAKLVWPGRSPVGECLPYDSGEGCATVIGVVENARRFTLREDPTMLWYAPLSPEDTDDRVLLIRGAPRGAPGAAALRRALLELDPNLPYLHVETLGSALDPQIRPWRLGATVFTAFGALAMLLAAVGLYSALAYATAQRTREIGIRLAIGARTADVVKLVLRDGVRVAVVGVVLGLGAALAGGRYLEALLFEVSPRDWRVLLSVGGSLLVVVLLASWGPARRATRVDPTVAMRAE